MNLIIYGPPGAGKGTQAKSISKKFNLLQLSTGDLLRDEIKKNTDAGIQIDKIISKGNFVNDNIVNKLLKNFITNQLFRNRIIFDGYPRNIAQAKSLEEMLNEDNQKIDLIFFLNVKRDDIEKRIIGRINCTKCKTTFNEFFDKEKINNHKCDKKFMKKRKDDNQSTIITRYDDYMTKTKPVLDFYSSRNYFHEIDGSQKIEEITHKIEHFLTV